MRLNHLHFASKAPEATREFYESYFGFRPHRRLGRTEVLVNEEHFLLAIDDSDSPDRRQSALHFGFCLDSPEKVEAAYLAMKNDGVPLEKELTRLSENAVQFYCFDPSGNHVEVGWYRNL